MESAIDPTEIERTQQAFMRRIAQIVLPEGKGIDRRDAMVLIDCGVIQPDRDEEPEEPFEPTQTGATDANGVSVGPLLFFCGGSDSRAVARARDLLLDERHQARRSTIAHLERTAASAGLMSGRTMEALGRLGPAIQSSEGWRRAAIELVDVLDDDWLLNIAGVGQCRDHNLDEQWSEYITAVLRPSMAAVGACSPSVLCPSLHSDAMNGCAARLKEGKQPLEALCAEYMETLGHVPLGGDCSLGQVLRARGGDEPMSTRLTTVLEWASRSSSPFARYHACEAALSAAAQLVPEQRDQVAGWFWETVLSPEGGEQPTQGHAAWELAIQLARYYMQYLEVRLPSDHGEAVAAMAWWMTVRLIAIITGGAGRIRAFGTQLDQLYGAMTAEIWDLIGPPMTPSKLRWLTTFGPSPWALSIMSAVQCEDDVRWLLVGPGPDTAEDRTSVLVTIAAQIAGAPLEKGHYRFSPAARRVLGWVASAEPDESRRSVMAGWADGIDWAPPDSLTKALDAVDQREVPVQRWMCHAIRQGVASGALSGEDLWRAVSADAWKSSTWLALDPVSVQALGCALIDDAVRRGPEWLPQLPHLFAEIAERRAGSESERPALIGMVLRACGASNTSSAISRLLRGRAGHRYRALATTVRGNLELALPQAGGWAAGRLRALMVDLLQ